MRVLLPLLLAATAAQAAPERNPADAQRYRDCLDLAQSAPSAAIERATAWRAAGGGVPARHCLAMAQGSKGDYAAAFATLTQAAQAAEAERDPYAADLWGQAGNAAMLANKPADALGALSSGIAVAGTEPQRLSALLIDRARAEAELKQTTPARTDLARATSLDPSSPFGWLLLATIERRQNDLPAAEKAILEAARRAPTDPDVGLEAANIAAAQGKMDLARTQWKKVVAGAPGSEAADMAAKALAANPG